MNQHKLVFSFAWIMALGVLAGCNDSSVNGIDPMPTDDAPPGDDAAAATDTAMIPLSDMTNESYLGFAGRLYPQGNQPPTAHHDAGLASAASVEPRDASGTPDPGGQYVLLSIGMSNTTQEFCSQSSASPCDSWTFTGQAEVDANVNQSTLAILNGAQGGQASSAWESPSNSNYDRIRDTRLAPRGLSEAQVQIVWLKTANPGPQRSLPEFDADAFELVRQMGNIVRALKARYPNLTQVFLSSRIYAGFASTTLNPEPYAYESGFAVKWLIEAQINQMATGTVDPLAGDLDLASQPWLGWAAYLWAAGTTPRVDGLTWVPDDFQSDGTHPGQSAEQKVGTLLLEFFKSSLYSKPWFMN